MTSPRPIRCASRIRIVRNPLPHLDFAPSTEPSVCRIFPNLGEFWLWQIEKRFTPLLQCTPIARETPFHARNTMPQLILSFYKCICRLGLFITGRRAWPRSLRYSRNFEQLETRVVFAGVPQLLLEQGFVPDSIGEYTEVAGTTYFVAATSETGRELWRLDDQSSTGAALVPTCVLV